MSKEKRKIRYKKERVVVSDILPFELPLIFTNHYFYKFLLNQNKNIKRKEEGFAYEFVKNIFYYKKYTVPYKFKIRHKEEHPRELTIIHPSSQIKVSEFYDKYKELILYTCNNSNYSLRKIDKVATIENYDDFITEEEITGAEEQEQYNKEYYSTSSFFKYKKFSRLFKFFDDKLFYNTEKKFDKMVHLDISRCFDSIYTHSISWSVLDKDFVKNNLTAHKKSFTDNFDILMQQMNYNETNGIVIGPEFSRIFAEIILQGIDSEVESELNNSNLNNRINYRIFRYIDDYFIFYNNDDDLKKIKIVLLEELEKFKFFINENKIKFFEKPIITNQTIAKEDVKKIIDSEIKVLSEDEEEKSKVKFSFNSNKIKRLVNTVIYNNKIDHDDVMNILVSGIENKIVSANKVFLENFNNSSDEEKKDYVSVIWGLLDVIFFFFSVKPKVNLTIKISYILEEISKTLKKINDKEIEDNINKKIYDEIYFTLNKSIEKSDKISLVESLYLLQNLKELGNNYRIEPKLLEEIIKLHKDNIDYLFITTIIFYIKDDPVFYKDIKDIIFMNIISILSSRKDIDITIDTEKILLIFDLLGLDHFLSEIEKFKILDFFEEYKMSTRNKKDVVKYIKDNKIYFTDWKHYSREKALRLKKYKNVY